MVRAFIALLLFSYPALAQFNYSIDKSIPVDINGRLLPNAWAGGLNSAQINTIDLDGDGKNDLVVFDRSSGVISTFLQTNNTYRHAPDYARLFPRDISHWMLLRDFNCDGKKDLFTSDPFGISVWVNITPAGGQLKWRPFNGGLPLLTIGFSGNINLKVNESDLPAIDDVDGDGDLDVLNVRFVGPGTVEWHRNMSVENVGKCDSMQFVRATQTYGNFIECSCGAFIFGPNATCPPSPGRVAHVGGKNMLTIDLDNDGDRELLFSEETCNRIYTLTNTGTAASATFTSLGLFPFSTTNVPLFPAPFLEDVDFDGKQDLIISPNVYGRTFTNWLVNNSVFLFRNSGTSTPVFTFAKSNFLQEDMLEVGDYSVPGFADVDGDGDEDMFVGFYAGQNFIGGVQVFMNTGTRTLPSYTLLSPDYFGLSGLSSYNFKPQLVDMNSDGKIDLAFTATSLQNGTTALQYLRNDAEIGIVFFSGSWADTGFRVGVTENLYIVDVNLDGKKDFLVGKGTGALEYWENTDPNGGFISMVRRTSAYLGVGSSTSRLNPVVSVGDLDADGQEDLILASHRGYVSIYPDFRNFDPDVQVPIENVIYNALVDSAVSVNLGGRIWPTVVNLFDNDKPAIVVGNTTGGLQVLKNVEGVELPEEPVITLFPNPLPQGDTLKVVTDRPATMLVYSLLGQQLAESMVVPANRHHPIPIKGLAPGMYVARFNIKEKYYSRRFIIY